MEHTYIAPVDTTTPHSYILHVYAVCACRRYMYMPYYRYIEQEDAEYGDGVTDTHNMCCMDAVEYSP